MKTLFTFTLLSFLAMTTLNVSAQSRSSSKRSYSKRNRTPMSRIVIGAANRYYHNDYLGNRVRRLERIVNQMQDHIVNLERVIDRLEYSSGNGGYGNGGYGSSGYFCELIGTYSGKIYTGQASSQRQASAQAYSSCTRGERNAHRCERNRVKCDRAGNSRY